LPDGKSFFNQEEIAMPVTLDRPFSWQTAGLDDRRMLDGLQPNILKAHVREFLTVLFLRFDQAAAGRTFLRALTQGAKPLLKSARTHLEEVQAFDTLKRKGSTYVGVGLTAAGYGVLGVPAARQPANTRFRAGMKAAQLGDPDPSLWDPAYRGAIHAVVLVGDQDKAPHDAALARVLALIRPGVVELGREVGRGRRNANGDGIEHFGYVDGRSQPLFLTEDVTDEQLHKDGSTNWNPAFGPGRAIVPDPAAPDPAHDFGSYFVFRKLEQNVKAFKQEELKLAARLGLTGDDAERAGAMLVGRFEDGTPLAIQSADGSHHPVQNDFTYDSDPTGGKCPHFAHIRKMNPRGSGGFEPPPAERLHIMARRGQTYGSRTDNPNDGQIVNKPSKDVGLLFMAFNAVIEEQFEFVQRTWANNAGFPALPPGRTIPPGPDPVIGQAVRGPIDLPKKWAADFANTDQHKKTTPVPQTVTMKGGEYFFMPSLAFLKAL
jgi:Dyp-type peroxidase family